MGIVTYQVNLSFYVKHKVKSRSGCGRNQAVDNAIRFCYSIGRERYLFELLSEFNEFDYYDQRLQTEAHKIGE